MGGNSGVDWQGLGIAPDYSRLQEVMKPYEPPPEKRDGAEVGSAFYVFDLDGTLADCEHRLHLLDGTDEGYRKFYRACDLDRPITPLIYLLKRLESTGAMVEIWTGRSAEVADRTTDWLREQGIHCVVRMRPVGDHRGDVTVKREWLNEAIEDGRKPVMAFEDRARVVAMWRAAGVPCMQVAEGDF